MLFVFVAWYAKHLLLLVFAAVLGGIFLRSLATWLAKATGIRTGLALASVCLLLAGIITASAWLAGGAIRGQAEQLSHELPKALQKVRSQIVHSSPVQAVTPDGQPLPQPSDVLPSRQQIIRHAAGIFYDTITAIGALVFLFFVALYLAASPELYREGALRLVPKRHRARARETLIAIGHTLQWWIVGQILAMTVVGVLTTVGLWIVGIPLALVLGLIAALFAFVPNIGPVLSAVPALLIAAGDSLQKVLIVAALYIAIQTVESYVITPQIHRRTVLIPPALLITGQVLMGVFAGALGVAMAAPLMAGGMVALQKIYLEDMLGETAPRAAA